MFYYEALAKPYPSTAWGGGGGLKVIALLFWNSLIWVCSVCLDFFGKQLESL